MLEFWFRVPTVAAFIVVASAGLPLWRAVKAANVTTLGPTVVWLLTAWLGWLSVILCALLDWPVWPVLHIALSLTACTGVSVLGARRPGLGAWNFVTLGLLAVLLLPLIEQAWSAPHWSLDVLRAIFTGLVLAVGVVNYVSTRWDSLAVATGGALWASVWILAAPEQRAEFSHFVVPAIALALALCVWGIWLILRQRLTRTSPVDELWLNFRDRYGLMWAKRVQEQFNQAALHGGYEERLMWRGLAASKLTSEREAQLQELLRAVLKRFGVN